MKPLAVMNTKWRTRRAALFGPNQGRDRSRDRPLVPSVSRRASQALTRNDAKDSNHDSDAMSWRILKPNIYYKAHNFALERIGSELSRQEPR